MKSTVTFIRRRGGDAVEERRLALSDETIRIGRGAMNEVHLADPRIRLEHACIRRRGDVAILEALSGATFTVDNRIERLVALSPDTEIKIGPYEVVVVEPGEGDDFAMTVEAVQPRGDTLKRLQDNSRTSLRETWINTRAVAWMLTLVILAGFLGWPIFHSQTLRQLQAQPSMEMTPDRRMAWLITAPDHSWQSGEISDPHKFFGNECSTCHRVPFRQVADTACTGCHDDNWHHADPSRVSLPALTEPSCQNCHKEHTGPNAVVRQDQAFCSSCHRGLGGMVADTKLLDAANFASAHPEFRPSVAVDPATRARRRMPLQAANWPVERSNLIFPHDKHLNPKGVAVPGQRKPRVLRCQSCHRNETGGGMAAITMERDCQECHSLRFEPNDKVRALPHGDFAATIATIEEYYGNRAMRGGVTDLDAPPTVRRRRLPGQSRSPAARRDALAWADRKITLTKRFAFGQSGCGLCHIIKAHAPNVGWRIEPVFVVDRWLTKGRFDHRAHRSSGCTDCHKAEASSKSADVLLPGIESCRNCHGGEHAKGKLPSTCVMCHDFHLGKQTPARIVTAPPSTARR